MLSAGPHLTGVQLLGNADNCTGVVLSFGSALDPAKAQDARAYVVGRTPPKPSDDGGFSFFPFALRAKPKLIRHGKVQFADAHYDDTAHSVTLTPVAPFKAWKYFRFLRVRGTGTFALTDPAGNPLDGNGDGAGGDDALIHWNLRRGKRVRFNDVDGDKVTLSLRGPGTLFVIDPVQNRASSIVIVEKTKAKSVLSGSVVAGPHGNGVVNLAQLSGISAGNATIVNNPAFQIQAVLP